MTSSTSDRDKADSARRPAFAFTGGAVIGTLGGLIGLGGAEFRLPLLISVFRFAALEAVILNKAMSLVVVATALPFRAMSVPLDDVMANWPIILNLLAGSLLGAWPGAGWATRLRRRSPSRTDWAPRSSLCLHGFGKPASIASELARLAYTASPTSNGS